MDTMRRAVRLDSVVSVPDYYQGQTGFLRGEGQVEDFMDTYAQRTKPEKAVSVYAVLALLASIGIGVTSFVMYGLHAGIQAAAVSLLTAAPASFFICLSRPTAILQKRLHRLGAVLCGWQGVEGLCTKAVFPLDSPDLFPMGTTKMNGMKFFGSRDPDQVIAYATAIICAAGSGLTPLFDQLLDSRNGRHYDVDSLRSYGAGGIGGEINGEPILLGELNFMKEMGVEIPEEIRVNQAVYVSVDGDLCALFAITYQRDRLTASALGSLCSYRKLGTVLTAGDFMLTESFIRSKFGVKTRRMSFPERTLRGELRHVTADMDAPALALMTQSGLPPHGLRHHWRADTAKHLPGRPVDPYSGRLPGSWPYADADHPRILPPADTGEYVYIPAPLAAPRSDCNRMGPGNLIPRYPQNHGFGDIFPYPS
jgi:hypothetical protein